MECDFDIEQYLKLFLSLRSLTVSTKLCNFQYNLLLHSIVTNRTLFIWKTNDNDLCTFCKMYSETYTHLFVECKYVKRIWNMLEIYLQQQNRQRNNFDFSIQNIMFNTVAEQSTHVVNLLILIVKQLIYRMRCANVKPAFFKVKEEIELFFTIEEQNAKQDDKKWNTFVRKWHFIKPNLELRESTSNVITEYVLQM